MKIATAAYPMDTFTAWSDFAEKSRSWVTEAANAGANLLVFPEYGAMEIASLGGPGAMNSTENAMRAISDLSADVDAHWSSLAQDFGVYILAPSAPIFDPNVHASRPVNRARLFAPSGRSGVQDKQIMTLFERDPMAVEPGGPLTLFDTALGKIGILICYDAEFPLLARALFEAGAEILLCPSCTEELSGYWRVRIGAMARALEGQAVSVMSSTVGAVPWSDVVDQNTGMGGIFGPPDTGFPDTGVLAEGTLNMPGWTYADVDIQQIRTVRQSGVVRNLSHWPERASGSITLPVTYCALS